MKTLLTNVLLLLTTISFGQGLLELNENEEMRQRVKFNTISTENKITSKDSTEIEKKVLPLLLMGSDLVTGSSAIGFRPILAAGTDVTKGVLSMSASLKFTQVDDQKFDVEKTGQTLFIKEISNFSANLTTTIGIPNVKIKQCKKKKDSIKPRFGFNLGIHLRGSSLFNIDSNTFKKEENDIFSFMGSIGFEAIVIPEYLSLYCNFNYLSITNNRDNFHRYFPENALKDFWYFQPGFKFRTIEGIDQFKGFVIDVSTIILTQEMKTIAGSQNTIIPVIKVGYTKKINWNGLINKENHTSNEAKNSKNEDEISPAKTIE